MSFDSIIRNAQNFINKELGLGQNTTDSFGGLQRLPWQNDTGEGEAFWKPIELKPDRWNKLYPYRLLVIDITQKGNVYTADNSGVRVSSKKASFNEPDSGGIQYVLSQQVQTGNWELTLPITPQQLQIQDQFAINTSATMRGVVEEHNGIKFKMISAQGTTGIWANKPTIGGVPKAPGNLGAVFGGALSNFSNVLNDFKRVGRAFAGDHPASVEPATPPEGHPSTAFSTGYYQAMLLGQFLERYAQLKKNPRNKNLRLVFDIPKQNKSFIVTPVNFGLRQNAQKPMEYMWNIQLKAWKRVTLDSPAPLRNELFDLDPNVMSRIVGTVAEARRTLSSAINLVKAVRSDFQKIFNIARQTALVVKDAAGLTASLIDLPRQIILDSRSATKAIASDLDQAGAIISDTFEKNLAFYGLDKITGGGGSSSGGKTTAGIFGARGNANEGLSDNQIGNGALGPEAGQSLQTDPTDNLFEEPEGAFDLFDSLSADSIPFTPQQQEAIDRDLESTRLINVEDYKEFRSEFLILAEEISNFFGTGDETYSQIYNKPDPKKRPIPITLEETEIIAAIYELIQVYDILTANSSWDDSVKVNTRVNSLDFVGGLANESDIPFEVAESKLLVPVPFGLTIEEIAARYLQNPDKWVEIATLNNLTSPYIDEEGFTYDFLSNGSGRQFNIDDTDDRIYVGQRILLSSDTVSMFARKVIDFQKIGDNNFLVTVDGADNLDSLTIADNAKIRGYLPGTVNSQNQIYIPIDAPSQENDGIRVPNHLDEDELTKISKIDWLISDEGDLIINQIGDVNLSNGLNNLIQALKLKVRTKKGTLLRHLDFGFGIDYGISIADIEAGVLAEELNTIVTNDPRFSGIERLDIRLDGVSLAIDMAVTIANNSGVVPITFDI